MALTNPHVGDIGTVFEVTVYDEDSAIVSLSGATGLVMYFTKPDGTVLTKTAVLSTTGVDGKMRYVSIAGDLDLPGWWEIQGKVTFTSANWFTDTHSVQVDDNLV